MNKIKVLITTVGGLTSPDILKAIRDNNEREVFLLGIDPFEYAVGRNFVDAFEISPDSTNNEEQFIKCLNSLVEKYNIDVLIPCGNEDNLAIAKHKDKINCNVMVGKYKSLRDAYDKGFVYNKIQNNLNGICPNFKIVNNYEDYKSAIKNLGFPKKKIVIKPRFGRGGRGVYILNNNLSYNKIFNSKPSIEYPSVVFEHIFKKIDKFEDLIVMEYLSDPFYSIYSLSSNRQNIFTIQHLRQWGTASQTLRGEVSYNKKIEKIASDIISLFNLDFLINFELAKSDDGRIVLFDLNPRIGASSGIAKDIGINLPYLAIKVLINEKIEIPKNIFSYKDKFSFTRYFDHKWI